MTQPNPTPPAEGSQSWAVSHREEDPSHQPTDSRAPAVIGLSLIGLLVLMVLVMVAGMVVVVAR